MDLALSPYDLTLLDPAAIAACLLGERVATFLPVPADLEPADVRTALAAAPRYARLLDAWRWSVPLWREGILCSLLAGEHAADDAAAVHQRLAADPAFAPLRSFQHTTLDHTSPDGLDLTAADLLKGGPDPGISLPLCAGLDAFAARTGALTIRRGSGAVVGPNRTRADSAAQAAERHLGATVSQALLALPASADARLILLARAATADARRALSAAIEHAIDAPASSPAPPAELRAAAAAFSQAIEAFAASRSPAQPDCPLVWVRIVLRHLPVESTLLSALAAAARISGRAPGTKSTGRTEPCRGTRAEPRAAAPILRTIVVEPMKLAPDRAAPRSAHVGAAHVR